MKGSFVKFIIGIAIMVALLISAPGAHAEVSSRKLEDVYTQERINCYKNLVKYYNPSLQDVTAERISKAIIYYSYLQKIEDDRFVAAVITVESMFNPGAVSRSGAQGLGQLMPGTAGDMQVKNAFNIEDNVWGSCKYLKIQLDRFAHLPRQQQYELTLAAYNAGPGAVTRCGGIPPYQETQEYVVKVINVWRQISGLPPVKPKKGANTTVTVTNSSSVNSPSSKDKTSSYKKHPVKMEIKSHYIYIEEPGEEE